MFCYVPGELNLFYLRIFIIPLRIQPLLEATLKAFIINVIPVQLPGNRHKANARHDVAQPAAEHIEKWCSVVLWITQRDVKYCIKLITEQKMVTGIVNAIFSRNIMAARNLNIIIKFKQLIVNDQPDCGAGR